MTGDETQQKRLVERLRHARGRLTQAETIPARPSPEMLPLSLTQERFWTLAQFDPHTSHYNRPILLRLQGDLTFEALQQALNEIVRRHEGLRATFLNEKGHARQAIQPPFNLPLSITDLGQANREESDEAVRRWVDQAIERPFELAQGPLLRAELGRLAPNHHLLLLVAHHILFDAWSARIFIREMVQLYEAFVEGRPSPLPDLPIQYPDFAQWQRERFESGQMQSDMNYWQTRLVDAPPFLELPLDHDRPKFLSHEGALCTHLFPDDLVARLKTLSREANVTLFMTLLTTFKILLHNYSRQTDIIVGSPIAGRTHVELEPLIGGIFNTLVLRTDLSGNPSFRALLAQVRRTTLEAYAHQSLPFEKLVETLNPPRDLSRTPVFQVMFNFENLVDAVPPSRYLTLEEIEFDHQTAYYEIAVELMETAEGLKGLFFYKTDLFEAATITRLLGHFQTLLQGIITQPDTPISQLPLLTEAERQQILVEWNDTQANYPQDKCIHHLFEAQVERTPNAVALVFEEQYLTYRALNHRANQMAHHLQSLGVKTGDLVGLCLERSIEMIVGILATLKAGGAYVPLDPVYPAERLAFMLADTQATVLLTQTHLLDRLPANKAQVVCLDDVSNEIQQQADTNPVSDTTATNLAYIIYTSGSTGQPKGVMIEHRALVNFTEMIAAHYNITAADRVLQFASISFDASAEEIYPALTRGATLVLRTDEMLASSQTFWQRCDALGLTVLDLPTAYWQQLVSDLLSMEHLLPKSLRLVILGGEKVMAEAVNVWLEYVPSQVRLVNSYGPTEATVVATVYDIAEKINDSVPIGRPIGNVQAYVLDQHRQPVPIGIPGELYIGGACLADGYLNRPELTAERFIDNPFGPGRLYKTGDLARYRPDGNIEFLGRIDNQVKIRGFRIELGEIETLLSHHPAVDQCLVSVREDESGEKRLVAYVVAKQEAGTGDQLPLTNTQLPITDLRHYLQNYLPSYMIPSVFVELTTLPLNSNGKIDYRALPVPDVGPSQAGENFVAPETPIEQMLAEMWQEILRLEQIGIHDNFFELGGHSLLATQISSRLLQDYGIEVTLRQLFECPTIAGLAPVIEELLLIDTRS